MRKERNENPKDYKVRLQYHAEKYFDEFKGSNPLETLVLAFKACLDSAKGDLYADPWKIRKFCVDNSCNNKKMREIIMQMRRMCKTLENYNIPGSKTDRITCEYVYQPNTVVPVKIVTPKLAKCLIRGYKGMLLTRSGMFHIISPDGHVVQLDTMKCVFKGSDLSQNYIPLSEVQFKGKKGMTIMISLWVPVDLHQPSFIDNYDSDDDDYYTKKASIMGIK